jgi:hypothetical protein
MDHDLKLTGYFAGALFSGQELYGNRALAAEINQVSQAIATPIDAQVLSYTGL